MSSWMFSTTVGFERGGGHFAVDGEWDIRRHKNIGQKPYDALITDNGRFYVAGLFGEPAVALPVQVYNWTQRSDPAFFERAFGAVITLLVFLLIMNALAIFLRRKFQRRW